MKLKVKMIIMSHLSDVQETLGVSSEVTHNNKRINFAKWLLLNYKDLNEEVDADEIFDKFEKEQIKVIV